MKENIKPTNNEKYLGGFGLPYCSFKAEISHNAENNNLLPYISRG